MQLGMIGLGRMGANMAERLIKAGHDLVVYDSHPAAVKAACRLGATGAGSLQGLRSEALAGRAPSGSWCPRRSSTRFWPTSPRSWSRATS